MMPTLVPPDRIGRLSGTGWATGYVGGILSLILVLGFLAANPATGRTLFGLTPLFGLDPVMAALLGMLTGIGGGMVRDVLVAEIPTVLRSELYAVAALAGAAVVVIGDLLHLPSTAAAVVGAALCFGLRVMAIRRGWRLPIARPHRQSEEAHPAELRDDDDVHRH